LLHVSLRSRASIWPLVGRLLKAIINPAMIVTWLAGIYLAWVGKWTTIISALAPTADKSTNAGFRRYGPTTDSRAAK
jgi:putative Mn2+ efflux pump MntP